MLPPKEQMEQLRREQERRFQEPSEAPVFQGFGPPDFEEVSARDEEDEYPTFEPADEYAPPEFESPVFDEEPAYGFTPPPTWEEPKDYPAPPTMRQNGASFLRDEVMFEGGPTRSEVASWKKQFEEDGHTVNLSEIGDEVFIWRSLNRVEYREIMALQNTDPLQREEIICEVCTLFPYEYNFTTMASRKAGVPAVLAEQIMKESGFQQPTPPIRL